MFVEEAASRRTNCSACGAPIAKGALRIVDRGANRARDVHRHLACTAENRREEALAALTARDISDELLPRALGELGDAKLVAEITAFREAHYGVPVVRTSQLDDPRTLLAALEATPDDRGGARRSPPMQSSFGT
jgi:hypothetical protein